MGSPGVLGVNWCSYLTHLGGPEKAKLCYGGRYQIWSRANYFQAENSYYGVLSDFKLIYLQVVVAGARFCCWEMLVPKVCSERWVYGSQLD